MVTNGSGKIAVSDVTSTELGHLDGVSSAIQTQLDAKSTTANATALAAEDAALQSRLSTNVTAFTNEDTLGFPQMLQHLLMKIQHFKPESLLTIH